MTAFGPRTAVDRVERRSLLALLMAGLLAGFAPATLAQKPESGAIATPSRVIWQDPGDIRTRDLYWGPGGEKHAPQGPLTFLKEDLSGHNPKLDVEDANGK